MERSVRRSSSVAGIQAQLSIIGRQLAPSGDACGLRHTVSRLAAGRSTSPGPVPARVLNSRPNRFLRHSGPAHYECHGLGNRARCLFSAPYPHRGQATCHVLWKPVDPKCYGSHKSCQAPPELGLYPNPQVRSPLEQESSLQL